MAALAACDAIEAVTQQQPQIKWVNDIFLEGKKVCGILTEGSFNLETGQWLGKTIGCRSDVLTGKPAGRSVFQKSAEGLAIIDGYLLAVDEGQDDQSAGRLGHSPSTVSILLFSSENTWSRWPSRA